MTYEKLDNGNTIKVVSNTNVDILTNEMKNNGLWNRVMTKGRTTILYTNLVISDNVVLTVQPYEVLELGPVGYAPLTKGCLPVNRQVCSEFWTFAPVTPGV